MKAEDIKVWDWQRFLIGEVPPAFLLEVVVRIVVVYIILLVSMRMMGKRMAAQLSRNELAAMVSLAAAIGVPILAPDRGIVPPFIIAIVVVIVSRAVSWLSARNEKIESITQGSIDTLVKDGVLQLSTMAKTRITKERIMAQLRSQNVMHLGQVKRLYMEANGNFTYISSDSPRPGLAVIPESDHDFLRELKFRAVKVCHQCGYYNADSRNAECLNCKQMRWVNAMEAA